MESTATLARDHQMILQALEVLRLMGDYQESDHIVDRNDVGLMLRFFSVAHECLENTEKLLLRPALTKDQVRFDSVRLGATLNVHNQVQLLFAEMSRAHESESLDDFVSTSRSYTATLAQLIYDERRLLPSLVRSAFTGSDDRQNLDAFARIEEEIGQRARCHSETLHRLETKYLIPHCI